MKIEVNFELTVPVNATDKQITEWIEYNLYLQSGSIAQNNPLIDYDIEADQLTLDWSNA